MSIYSGFATRTQENYYDQILYNIISTLLVRISKFYQNETVNDHSFFKILTSQQKCLKKLQKRKYLQPKYAQLLQHFLNFFAQEEPQRQKQQPHMNRTLSVLDKEFRQLRDAHQKYPTIEKGDAHSLTKIEEKIKKNKRKSKSKRNSIKGNLDVWQFKAEKKPPQLPTLQPLEQTLMTRSKFNTRVNFSQVPSKDISDAEQDSIREKGQRKMLIKPPKFRAKMFFKEKQKGQN